MENTIKLKADYSVARRRMVDEQIAARGIHDRRVIEVMMRVPRHLFVEPALTDQAYGDYPVGIGSGQTISQPYMVALMTEALRLTGIEKVLEIGTGCGYQTAVLAELVGQVCTIEKIRELAFSARRVLRQLKYRNILLRVGDGSLGWREAAPFDGILVAAGSPEIPKPLVEQLTEGGRLIVPVGNEESQSLMRIIRRGNQTHVEDLGGCRFVKLVGKFGWGGVKRVGDKIKKRSLVAILLLLFSSCAEFSDVFEIYSSQDAKQVEHNGDREPGREIPVSSATPSPTASIEADKSRFIWPVEGVVTSRFGVRRGRQHDGIDISAPRGTPVKAAARGKIVYSNRLSGYGNLIIMKHAGNYFTAYAHLSQSKVTKGKKVEQGDLIGLVGSTGKSSGPHCHFEIRQKTEARNPLFFLSEKKESTAGVQPPAVGGKE